MTLPADLHAVIHCESSLAGDPRACCDFAASRTSISSPQWPTRAFIFAVRHSALKDRCCPKCVAWLQYMLGGEATYVGTADRDDSARRFALIELDLYKEKS